MPYKVTNQDGKTQGGTQWAPDITHNALGAPDQPLCTDSWIHYYETLPLAVFMHPTHTDFPNPRFWEFEPIGNTICSNDKSGARAGRTVREVQAPAVTTEQRIAFGIFAALEVSQEPSFTTWAEGWLSGSDRSNKAARAAAEAAARAAWAAAWAAEAWAAEAAAARAAAWAAEAAARAAAAEARAAARAAEAAAAWAARAAIASRVTPSLDLAAIAQRAIEWIDPLASTGSVS